MKRSVCLLGLGLFALGVAWAVGPRPMSTPADNPLTPEKIELGRRLFYDPRLSSDGTISCASCHKPELAFSDGGKATSTGVYKQVGTRNSPTLTNVGYRTALFSEGRSPRLELQAIGPLTAADEMSIQPEELTRRLEADSFYTQAFQGVFGEAPSMRLTAYALSAFERTLVSLDSPYDRYLAGDTNALSQEAKKGLQIFMGKGGCSACHQGPDFTDDQAHNIGLPDYSDVGLARATGDSRDIGKFKTPTLRNIALTAPYMHDGSLKNLTEVVQHFGSGGKDPNLDPLMQPLKLSSSEVNQLVAFLESLTDIAFTQNPKLSSP